MATSRIADSGGIDLAGISSLANLFLGKTSSQTTQNSGGVSTAGSRTTSTNVSQDAVDAVVKSILEGSQGLASVAKGQRSAGLYNSSTNQMLVNDLIARAAAEGAKLNKSETTSINESTADNRSTQVQNTAAPQIKPATGAKVLAGLQGLGTLVNSSAGKKLLAQLGLGSAAKSAGGGNAPSAPVNDGTVSSSGFDSNVPQTPSLDATTNSQAVASYGNNPSAFVAGDNTQIVNPLTTSDFAGISDLSFDQTAVNGLDFGGGSDYDFSGSADFGVDTGTDVASNITGEFGAGDFGVDPTTIDYSGDFDISDMFDFAEGGLVTPHGNMTLIRKYAGGGYVNMAAEKAFDSGGDEPKKTNASNEPQYTDSKSGVNFFKDAKTQKANSNDPRAATEEYKPKKSLGVQLFDRIRGYASGGLVTPDITNTGLRAKNPGDVNSASPITGEQVIGTIFNRGTRTPGTPSRAVSNIPGSSNTGMGKTKSPLATQEFESTEGTPGTGVSGTPESNQAAINGALSLGITTALGIPGIVGNVAMSALGIPNTNMNPISQLVSLVSGLVGPDGMQAAAAAASAANPSPTASDDNAAVANAIAAQNDTDPLDALIGIVSDPESPANTGNDGTSAEGGGIGGSGNSAGGDSSNGEGDGGGTATAAKGGMIRGPGTPTSDSIPARLSDGEYVIKAAVVDHYGKDFFDRLNNSIQVA